jgi:hypothetical protein
MNRITPAWRAPGVSSSGMIWAAIASIPAAVAASKNVKSCAEAISVQHAAASNHSRLVSRTCMGEIQYARTTAPPRQAQAEGLCYKTSEHEAQR